MLLNCGKSFTAVMYPDDFTAIAAYRDLAAAGLYVGKNISVTGFDGVSIGSMVSPRLTTIRQDAACIGVRAAELLIGLIDGSGIKEGMERLDFTLVPGESVYRLD